MCWQLFDSRTLRCLQSGSDALVFRCSTAVYDHQRAKYITLGSHARAWAVHQLTATVPRATEGDADSAKAPRLLGAFLSTTLLQVGR